MDKISLRKGILAAGLIMALSPATLLADTVPAEVPAQRSQAEMQKEIERLQQEQERLDSEIRQQRGAQPDQYKEIQDIPDPKNLGSD
jgi:hypothetical protein